MRTIFQALEEIAKNTSNNDKIDMVAKVNAEFAHFSSILVATYHPLWIYGIKKFSIPDQVGVMTIEHEWYVVDQMLCDLRERVVTGKRALTLLDETLSLFTDESQKVIEKIILRDLKCGFSASTINKAIPKLIGTFDVALAVDLKKCKDGHLVLDGKTWLGSRKLDGLRLLTVKEGTSVEFFSRTGKEMFTLGKLKEVILEVFDGIDGVIDGEVCIIREDGSEDFTAIVSEYNRKKHTIENPKYLVFDLIPLDIFFKKVEEPSETLSKRIQNAKSIIDGKNDMIEVLDQTFLTEEVWDHLKEESKSKGWEGVMGREDIPYVSGRKTSLIKHKLFEEGEFVVVDVERDDFTAKVKGVGQKTYENVVKRLVIEYKGFKVGVGTGLKIDQRIAWSEDPSLIIGNEITVRYFEESSNKNGGVSMRFPSLKAVWDGKRKV